MASTIRRVYLVRDTLTGDERLVRSTKPSRARDRYSNLRLEATLATQEEMYQHGLAQREILDDDAEDLDDEMGDAQAALDAAEGAPPAPTPAEMQAPKTWDEPLPVDGAPAEFKGMGSFPAASPAFHIPV